MIEISPQTKSRQREYGVLNVIGIFLSVFGVAVLMAIFFSDSLPGKIANLLSGFMILAAATLAFIGARLIQKRR